MTYLDTHVVAWLYEGERRWLSAAARKAIEEDEVIVSPMAVLELELLHEIRRLDPPASKVVEALVSQIGLTVCDLPFHTVVRHARELKWTRDPFDRLIVANAKAANAALITKDARILRHYSKAIW